MLVRQASKPIWILMHPLGLIVFASFHETRHKLRFFIDNCLALKKRPQKRRLITKISYWMCYVMSI